jgi:hypothetical protein
MCGRIACRLAVFLSMGPPLFAQTALPSLHDGAVLSGPGEFQHQGELFVQGRVTLRNMTLRLHGSIAEFWQRTIPSCRSRSPARLRNI